MTNSRLFEMNIAESSNYEHIKNIQVKTWWLRNFKLRISDAQLYI